MDFNVALQIALNTPSGGPQYYAAEAICRIRGIDPWSGSPTLSLPNWQAIIVEQLLGNAIAEMLR